MLPPLRPAFIATPLKRKQPPPRPTPSHTPPVLTAVFYNSISCMPEYSGKSPEELRWEDYQVGPGTGAVDPSLPLSFIL